MLLIRIVSNSVASHYTNKANTETSLFNVLFMKMEDILFERWGKTKRAIQKDVHPFTISTI